MAGRIIGLIPVQFVIVLLENHVFYDEQAARAGDKEGNVELARRYMTAVNRQESDGGHLSRPASAAF
jgi:hypothetical protein